MATEISNNDDIIDSRDVIERIAELEAEYLTDDGEIVIPELYEHERDEYEALTALASEAEGYAADWQYGETLIRDSYFETYARELAEEIGAIDPNAGWPLNRIDWEAAAEALQQDYTSVEFDGVTYWVR